MSMTSKVNSTLRQEIIRYLAYGSSTNQQIYYGIPSMPSLRKIQEATQKLVKDGTLVRNGNTFSVAPETEVAVATPGGIGIANAASAN